MTSSSDHSRIPVVCTLSDHKRDEQLHDWKQLFARASGVEAVDDGVSARFPIGLLDDIEALATAERACCGSWLQIRVTRDGQQVRLVVSTQNADGLGLIRELVGAT